MAKILFGGPQEIERGQGSPEHDDLVKKLREVHDVNYIVRGDEMMGELTMPYPMVNDSRVKKGMEPIKPYDLVIYETQLFYDSAETQKRASTFRDSVIDWLKLPQIPVIILADEQVANQIKDPVNQAGFRQINKPCDIEEVLEAVDDILK
jgi:hypothetical protein